MANEKQLSILKQGAEAWNEWRRENPTIKIDLCRADLFGADISGSNLRESDLGGAQLSTANLSNVNMNEANLEKAYLFRANLKEANLVGSKLVGATLIGAHLMMADLTNANLQTAFLIEANLTGANLTETDLTGASLAGADLRDANLTRSIFSRSIIGSTVFGNSDLSQALGLESATHHGPSNIATTAFAYSKGQIPDIFLRGCGLSDWEIENVRLYDPNLSNAEINNIQYRMYDLRASRALQLSPLFISYSHADSGFVDRIGDSLTSKGIRYWRDIHDMKSGRMETQIDRAIRQNPTVLLVLSEHSLSSDWVEHEVRTARALEKDMGRDVLCPVALDDSWKASHWPKRVMEQIMEYNILDFSAWENDVRFETMFHRLIDGLGLFYKG